MFYIILGTANIFSQFVVCLLIHLHTSLLYVNVSFYFTQIDRSFPLWFALSVNSKNSIEQKLSSYMFLQIFLSISFLLLFKLRQLQPNRKIARIVVILSQIPPIVFYFTIPVVSFPLHIQFFFHFRVNSRHHAPLLLNTSVHIS